MNFKHVVLSLSFLIMGFGMLQAQNEIDVVTVAEANADLEMLVSAINSADLATSLKGKGPFTVFAPSNSAFNKLSDEKLDKLLMNENKQQLQQVLSYHVLDRAYDAKSILAAIQKGNGRAVFTTMHGGKLIARLKGGNIVLEDELGNVAQITSTDIKASNGMIHFIDSLLMPLSSKKSAPDGVNR